MVRRMFLKAMRGKVHSYTAYDIFGLKTATTTKLFCGHLGTFMIGESSTSHTGKDVQVRQLRQSRQEKLGRTASGGGADQTVGVFFLLNQTVLKSVQTEYKQFALIRV